MWCNTSVVTNTKKCKIVNAKDGVNQKMNFPQERFWIHNTDILAELVTVHTDLYYQSVAQIKPKSLIIHSQCLNWSITAL